MTNSNIDLAVIIPVYNEAKTILDNFEVINRILQQDGVKCAYLFVDDGSKDDTWCKLQDIQQQYKNVLILRFSRNFGKEIAICAGLDHIDAQRYLIMDSDLQHPPRYVKDMLNVMFKESADIVEGVKISRGKETLKYKLISKSFYKFLKSTTGIELDNSSDFKLINRSVVDALRNFNEKSLFFRGLVDWVGFKKVAFPFEVDSRGDGTTRFSTKSLVQLALTAIIAHTSKPLFLIIVSGVVFFVLSIILGIQTLFNFFSGYAVSGFSTVILLLLFTGSMIMLSLGIIGIYLSRIYDEVKGRPRYIIANKGTNMASNCLVSEERRTPHEAQ